MEEIENSTCPKCKLKFGKEVYMLACMHNFCGACILKMKNGESTTCDLCPIISDQNEVTRNTFLEKMMSFQKHIDDEKKCIINCEICDPEMETNVAENYCMQCSQYICSKCSKSHIRTRATSTHNIVDRSKVDKTVIKNKEVKCVKHSQDLTMYCKEYNILVCSACYEMSHTDHKDDEEVKQIIEQSELKIKQKIEHIDELIRSQKFLQKENEKKEFIFNGKVNAMRADIDETAKQLKALINMMRFKLINKLEAYKVEYIKDIYNNSDERTKYISELIQMKSYMQGVVDNGSNLDIFDLKNEIDNNKWNEKHNFINIPNHELSFVSSKFDKTAWNCNQLFGFFKESKIFSYGDIIKSSRSYCFIENDLYALDLQNQCIDIYDINSLLKTKIELLAFYKNLDQEILNVNNQLIVIIHDSRSVTKTILKYSFIKNIFEQWQYGNQNIQPGISIKNFLSKYYNESFVYQLIDNRYIDLSFNINELSIRLSTKEKKLTKSISLLSTYDITACTDGKKFILYFEKSSINSFNKVIIFSTELQLIREFSILDVINISYDRVYDKFMVITKTEIQYWQLFLE